MGDDLAQGGPGTPAGAAGVVVLDGSGRVLGADAAAVRLVERAGPAPSPGTDWQPVEDGADDWLVTRRERVADDLVLVHLAPVAAPAGPGAPAPDAPDVDPAYLSAVLECLDTGVLALDASLAPVVVNAALRRLHGHDEAAGTGQWPGRPQLLMPDGSPVPDEDRLVARVLRHGSVQGARLAVRDDSTGQLRQVSANARVVQGPDGGVRGVAFAVHDITDAVAARQALQVLAEHDELTGLLNRRGLVARLTELASDGAALPAGVLVCDVDKFKSVNDTLGHSAGDHLLRTVALALNRAAGEGAVVARLGGDEFAVVVWDDVAPLPDRVAAALAEATVGHPLGPSLTCGTARALGPVDTLHAMLDRADRAMYDVRRSRRRPPPLRAYVPS